MIVGQGLISTGALEPVGRMLANSWRRSPALSLLLTILMTAILSAFINNTPIVVLMLPILIGVAIKTGMSPSGSLMPMGFASIMGGMATTIGTSTNLLVDTVWSGVYRVSETTSGDNQRPVMANMVSLGGLFLPQGTYWLDWQADGNDSISGPWAPPITIDGQTTTGNALQYSNLDGTAAYDWRNVEDSGTLTPQGFPILIEGVVGGCSPSDIPWVSVSPDTGTTPSGSSTNIDVTFDSTGYTPGTYTGNLCIFSNDLSQSLVIVPLTMHISDEILYFPFLLR
jgi:hypothetical protein